MEVRQASDILREAFKHGKRRIAVTPEEFQRVVTFRAAYLLTPDDRVDEANQVIVLRNGSKIFVAVV